MGNRADADWAAVEVGTGALSFFPNGLDPFRAEAVSAVSA